MKLKERQKEQFKVLSVILLGIAVLFFVFILIQPQQENNLKNGYTHLANPAAVYCEGLGYNYKIVTNLDGSQYGICIFPDGKNCSGWSFFRGKCGKEYSYCEKNNGTLIIEEQETSKYTVCILPNGTRCKEFDYFRGECP